jgi:DNA-binding PadR family transcriptional regulator
LLEDLGHVTVIHRDGKKVYTITEEGREFLEEHRGSVEEIWGRAGRGWNPELVGELHEIKHELGDLGRLFGRKMRSGRVDQHKLRRVREVIVRAAREIEGILEEQDDAGERRV